MKLKDKEFLKMAIKQAKISVEKGGFPAGAIVVKDGKVISRGVSIGFQLNDPTSHPETSSVRKACKKLKTVNLDGTVLYGSLQPCLMCFSVANWAGISSIVYACRKELISKDYYEGNTDIHEINEKNNRQIELVFIPDFEAESLKIVKMWEEKQVKKLGGS